MALLSRASCDIASKMVTGRSANTLFMEVMETVSRRSWSAIPRPSRPACPPPDACRKQGHRLARPATPSPTFSPSGRQKPPVCPGDPEYPRDRNRKAERPRRPDRLPRRLHSARGRRPADSVPPLPPSTRLPASNREPDDPPLTSSQRSIMASEVSLLASAANLAPGATKIKRWRQPGEPPARGLDRHLRSHLDHPSAGNLEIVGRIVGGAAQRDE